MRIVVDADVSRSSGTTEHPRSVRCRATLDSIRTERHLLVLTEAILEEWQKHASNYAKQWLAYMRQRSLVVNLGDIDTGSVVALLNSCSFTDSELAAAVKDSHLVRAALSTDRILISMDRIARNLFARAAADARSGITRIAWVDPMDDGFDCAAWIRSGAYVVSALCLVAE